LSQLASAGDDHNASPRMHTGRHMGLARHAGEANLTMPG
jgi:hypothetical protein